MKVGFDSRPAKETHGIARYCRCLLAALQSSGADIVETHKPRNCDVYHSPWIDGAMLRPPVPMVVTLHDLIPLKRRGEYLRSGLRFRLRYLAVQRASRVIVPTHVVAADAHSGQVTVGFTGFNRLGEHLTGTAELTLPAGDRETA